jgi:hypothetical protein
MSQVTTHGEQATMVVKPRARLEAHRVENS